MNLKALFEKIIHHASPDRILDDVKVLWENNRWSNFSGYRDTAAYVLEQLDKVGVQTESLEILCDGETRIGDAVLPLAWDCEDAVIEVDEQFPAALNNLKDAPNLIGMWSPNTPEEGIRPEIVYIPQADPQTLELSNVQGKLILTHTRFEEIRPAASRLGAAGIISSFVPNPRDKSVLSWIGANSNRPGGWGPQKNETPLLALSISPEIAVELGRHIAEHPRCLAIKIKSNFHTGNLPMVTAVIPGESDEEVMLLAPLYGQGANFPAVGAAVVIEAVRTLHSLIQTGSLPRPYRSMRILLVPKLYGSLAFAVQSNLLLKKIKSALCLETGAGNPDISWCRWSYRTAPVGSRHFTDGLGWQICREYLTAYRPQRFLEKRAFALAADVFFNDPALGISTQWLFGGTPEECRNTSNDTPETIDRRSLADLVTASASILYQSAAVSVGDIPQLAFWNFSLAQERMRDDVVQFLKLIQETETADGLQQILLDAKSRIPLRIQVESQSLQSLEMIAPNAEDSMEWGSVFETQGALEDLGNSALELIQSQVESQTQKIGTTQIQPELPHPSNPDNRIPERIGPVIGTITLDSIPYEQWPTTIQKSPRTNVPLILSWWLADGKRSIAEIENLIGLECSAFRENIPEWFTFLEKQGYVRFR